jgi:N-acetylgalactosamine kinase
MPSETKQRMAAVILAAGQGTRMRSATMHKVCFPVAGVPAINRLVGTLRNDGASTVVVVVGALAGDVVQTVGAAFPETLFALQAEQKGTGDAARCGYAPLETMGFAGPILVTYGDKVVAPGVAARLAEEFYRTRSDAAFVVSAKSGGDQALVALSADGGVEWILESPDVDRARVMAALRAACEGQKKIEAAALNAIVEQAIPRKTKREKLLGPALAELVAASGTVEAAKVLAAIPEGADTLATPSGPITAEQAARRGKHANEAVYLFRAEALSEGLSHLTAHTAQGEQYLPDVLTYLVRARDAAGQPRFKVRASVLENPQDVMAFNTPDQLVAIEGVIAARERSASVESRAARGPMRLDKRLCRPAGEWLKMFESDGPALQKTLQRIYGTDADLLAHRKAAYLKVLTLFVRRHGADRAAVISRAPGRVNLMGRHVEHRGGYINPMAINREVLMVASPREDDSVTLTNVDPKSFPDRAFSISGELSLVPWEDWISYINSRRVQQMVLDAKGDWANYVKAACLRLQQSFRSVRLRGFDATVVGDIPMAAGLSSSSAIVVAAGEATIASNGLDLTASDFVDLCGEGEWYVGSRGGAGDHAAMKFGRRNQVSRVRFFPFAFEYVPGIGDEHRLVVFNSQVKAQKSSNARDVFNQKVAAYEFGLMMTLDRFPHYGHLVEYLRDLNAERLHIRPHVIYEILLSLPQSMTREQLRETLSATHRDKAERIFQTHSEPKSYDIRSVMLYGLAECARSERAGELLRAGRLDELGRTMNLSHDGDRVARLAADGTMQPHEWHTGDAELRMLVADLQSEQPERVERAQLYRQPGGYACSVPEIDFMVDLALATPGVLGAQLSGAGLGGCMMVLCRADAVDRLNRRMAKEFYKPRGSKLDATVCSPIEGSGLLSV